MSKVEDILASTKVGDVLDAAKLNKFLKRQEEDARVSGWTTSGRLITRDTVAMETFASFAISLTFMCRTAFHKFGVCGTASVFIQSETV